MSTGYGVDIPRLSFKRCYTITSVVAQGDGFTICLDNQPLYTPGGMLLTVPSFPLADAIAAEWQVQSNKIHPTTLPLTQLVNTAIDCINQTSALRQQVLDALLTFATTDLVCYQAVTPTALVELQQIQWQPLLDWVARCYGAPLKVTIGVMPVPQSPTSLIALRTMLAEMDSFRLAALYRAATLCSSLVIALALVKGKIDADSACTAAQIDVLFQAERWGVDTAVAVYHNTLQADLHILARFVRLLETVPSRII